MGNNSSKKITSQDRAILDMKLQRDKIKQYQKRLQVVLDHERQVALQCLKTGNKEKARLALRRRKYQEQLLAKADAQLETLETLTQSIEFALMEKDVLYGLQQGNLALKEINKEMSIESVEKLMDETAASVAYQKEISELLAGKLTNDEEDEVEDELAAIEAEQSAQLNPESLPTVPSGEIVSLGAQKEAEQKRRSQRARERKQQLLEAGGTDREMIPA